MSQESVILVDPLDQPIGIKEKLQAHLDGDLHRAFSIFLFNAKGEWLLQRRALDKYHSGGLWSNTCCSHPRPGESLDEACKRRLQEEMGISCDVKKVFNYTYRVELEPGLVEHELDHVFVGLFEGTPHPNPLEVMQWQCLSYDALKQELESSADSYTAWFKLLFERVWQNNPLLAKVK